MFVYGKIDSFDQVIDYNSVSLCPAGYVQMQNERPPAGKWKAVVNSDSKLGDWVEIPATPDQQAETERAWRDHQLGLADHCFAPAFGPVDWTEAQRQTAQAAITDYIRLLKTGPNSHPDFPNDTWRPSWPEDVPMPAA